jgi:hypothetical protein
MDRAKKSLRNFTSYTNAPATIEDRLEQQARMDASLGIDPTKKRPDLEYNIIFPASDKSQRKQKR